jgi:hypothetical protein
VTGGSSLSDVTTKASSAPETSLTVGNDTLVHFSNTARCGSKHEKHADDENDVALFTAGSGSAALWLEELVW